MRDNKISNIIFLFVFLVLVFFAEKKLSDVLCASDSIKIENMASGDMEKISGYTKEGERLVPTGVDPSIVFQSRKDAQMNHILVRLSEKLPERAFVQAYYDGGNGFQETDSVVLYAEQGCQEIEISVPPGNYEKLRLDIDGSFSLKGVELWLKRYQNNAFKNTIFWGCAIFLNVLFVFLLNRKLCIFPVVSFREQFAYRRERLILWGALLLVGILLVNSLYLGESTCYYKMNHGNTLLHNIKGYKHQSDELQLEAGKSGSYDLKCPENVRGVILYFESPVQEDLSVNFAEIASNGDTGEKKRTIWEKNTNSVKYTGFRGATAGLRVEIPLGHKLSTVYYIISEDNILYLKAALCIFILILSYGMSTMLLCSCGVVKGIQEVQKRGGAVWQMVGNQYKKILEKAVVVAAMMFVAVLFNEIGSSIFGWRSTVKSAVFFVGIALLFSLVLLFRKSFAEKTEWMGFLCILIAGSVFAFTAPPYLGISWDDETHYREAVRLSHILDSQLSFSDNILLTEYGGNAIDKEHYSEAGQISYNVFLNQLERAGAYSEDGDASFTVSDIVYFPSALGLAVGRGIGLPFHLTVILGRWMNVWLLAILCYFAMKRLKSGKLVVPLVALIPTNIFIAANYNYDTWLTGWTILGLSALFGEWQRPEEKITGASKCLIAGALFIAVIAKETYFILTLIALFLPDKKFQDRRKAWGYRGFILAAVLAPFILLYFGKMGGGNVAAISDSRGGSEVSSQGQIEFILQNPGTACMVFFRYLRGYLNPFVEGEEYLSRMGYFGTLKFPAVLILAVFTMGAAVSREEREPVKFPWWFKLGILAEYIGIGAMSAAAMYIAYTAVGAATVEGCQGRYLLPVIFPVWFVLSRFSGKTYVKNMLREENCNALLLIVMVLFGWQGLWTNCLMLF